MDDYGLWCRSHLQMALEKFAFMGRIQMKSVPSSLHSKLIRAKTRKQELLLLLGKNNAFGFLNSSWNSVAIACQNPLGTWSASILTFEAQEQ